MSDGTGTGQNVGMDAADAAAIMQDAGEQARRRLQPSRWAPFLIWGLLLLSGYGLTWLAVRHQVPYHGPSPAAFAVVTLIAMVSAAGTMEESRAESGVGGRSVIRRRVALLSAIGGLGAMFALEGALDHAGASRAVLAIFTASAPALVLGLLYLTRATADRDGPVAGLGLWLLVVAAVCGLAGPRAVWGIDALAVGLA